MDQLAMEFEQFVDQRNFESEEIRLRHKKSWLQEELAKAKGKGGTDWDKEDKKRQRALARTIRAEIKEVNKCLKSL